VNVLIMYNWAVMYWHSFNVLFFCTLPLLYILMAWVFYILQIVLVKSINIENIIIFMHSFWGAHGWIKTGSGKGIKGFYIENLGRTVCKKLCLYFCTGHLFLVSLNFWNLQYWPLTLYSAKIYIMLVWDPW